jgi:RHS repeat-associated protein
MTECVPQHYKFTGKERDSESGLDNFGARYHASALGRFMTPDSPSYSNRKNPQSWNLYAYALNNPVTFRDADGHKIDCANNTEQCQKDAVPQQATLRPRNASLRDQDARFVDFQVDRDLDKNYWRHQQLPRAESECLEVGRLGDG